jgi:hypothetical protein
MKTTAFLMVLSLSPVLVAAPVAPSTAEAPVSAIATPGKPVAPEAAPAPVKKAVSKPHAHHKVAAAKPAPAPVTAPVRTLPATPDVYREAGSLLVTNEKYIIKYEDEEGNGRPAQSVKAITAEFTPQEVTDYGDAVRFIADYRGEVKAHCPTTGSQSLVSVLDQYADMLATFHRRALHYAGDISENNNHLVLVVNRSALKDATVLISRYLQFKKARFQDSMDKFLPADNSLVSNLVTVARVFNVSVGSDDWNRKYSVREAALESISAWPRVKVFDATQALAGSREQVCVVELKEKPALADQPKPAQTPSR